ncbi:MAG: c-type cytochrome [Alphaproteobacteria bacterium]
MERTGTGWAARAAAMAAFAGVLLAQGCEAVAGAPAQTGAAASSANAATAATAADAMRGSAPAAPASAPATTTAAAADTVSTDAGAAVFQRKCAPCHGPGGRGDGPEAQFFARAPRDLRTGFIAAHADDEMVAKIRDGHSLRVDVDPEAMRQRARETEQIATWMRRLPGIDWDVVERGNEVYLDRCEVCHGPFGRVAPTASLPPGVRKLPRDLSSPAFQRSVTDRQLAQIARHGRAGMPAIPGLDGDDLAVLVPFLRTLSPGHELYGVYCASCHGEDGRGSTVMAAEGDRPPVVFDRAWFKKHDAEDLRGKIWHMLAKNGSAMPHFSARITDAQAREIVAWLRATSPQAATSPAAAGKAAGAATAPAVAPASPQAH